MKRLIVLLFVGVAVVGTGRASAQESGPGPARVELSIIPGGGVFFAENDDATESSFGNYNVGGAVTINFNRFVGIEGEVAGGLGVTQSLQAGGFSSWQETPHLLNHSGNLVLSAAK